METNQYLAGIAIPPGETLQEVLDDRMLSQKEAATRLNCTPKHLNQVIQGKASITAEFALKLEYVLNIPAQFWLNLESHYRETLSRLEDIPYIEGEEEILKKLPYAELQKKQWVPPAENVIDKIKNLRKFFSVSSLDLISTVHNSAFRKSDLHIANDYAIASWINQAEILSKTIDASKFNMSKLNNSIETLKKLTLRPLKASFIELQTICATFGVVIVVLDSISKTHINGLTKWLSNDRVLIAISPRGGYEDIFWFTFFHELGHVVQKKKDRIFVDADNEQTNELEKEADEFALRSLLSSEDYKNFINKNCYNDVSLIRAFCRVHSIHPGILVGRLMKEGYISFGDSSLQKLRVPLPK